MVTADVGNVSERVKNVLRRSEGTSYGQRFRRHEGEGTTGGFPVSSDLDDELLAHRLQIDASSDGFLATGAPTVGGGSSRQTDCDENVDRGHAAVSAWHVQQRRGATKVHGVRSWLLF